MSSRLSLSLLVVALGAIVASAPTSSAQPLPVDPPRLDSDDTPALIAWGRKYLDETDWLQYGVAHRILWLVSNIPTDRSTYPVVRDWVRTEVTSSASGPHSSLQLVEVDCKTKVYYRLRSIFYKNNNLRGPILSNDEPVGPKPMPVPFNSIAEGFVNEICAAPA